MGTSDFAGGDGATPHAAEPDWLCRRLAVLPRPLRFLAVGSCGFVTDLAVFTALPFHFTLPLSARAISLAAATLVTWRLNRALTFRATGRRSHDEALRYAIVTGAAQGTSFIVFTILVLSVLAALPQAALAAGAVLGAGIAYTGHTLFAFRPLPTTAAGVRRRPF